MEQFTLKSMKKSLGTPATAVIIAAAIFMLPKIIYDHSKYYKEVGHHISETLWKHNHPKDLK